MSNTCSLLAMFNMLHFLHQGCNHELTSIPCRASPRLPVRKNGPMMTHDSYDLLGQFSQIHVNFHLQLEALEIVEVEQSKPAARFLSITTLPCCAINAMFVLGDRIKPLQHVACLCSSPLPETIADSGSPPNESGQKEASNEMQCLSESVRSHFVLGSRIS